jgi:hypothetical protein
VQYPTGNQKNGKSFTQSLEKVAKTVAKNVARAQFESPKHLHEVLSMSKLLKYLQQTIFPQTLGFKK